MLKISIITTCKSRLHHLKQVLDTWVKFKPYEIIVVNVDSPDGLESYLLDNYPAVKITNLKINGFNISAARNHGARIAKGDYLFFVDADIHITADLHRWFDSYMLNNSYAVRFMENKNDGIHEQGTVLVSKENFLKVEGYDEIFSGYGGEDHDFYEKLHHLGCKKIEFPKFFIKSLDHSDAERLEHYSIKNKVAQSIINRTYRTFKRNLLSRMHHKFELPLNTRKKIWNEVNQQLGNEVDFMHGKSAEFTFITKKWLPPPFYLEEKITVCAEVKTLKLPETPQ
jgi:glycosyltransferase involved in cell wall biosynthesis